jgi:hypothetical protein
MAIAGTEVADDALRILLIVVPPAADARAIGQSPFSRRQRNNP